MDPGQSDQRLEGRWCWAGAEGIFEQHKAHWLLELFCSVEVVITASQSLRDIANLRENGPLISVRTVRFRFLITDYTYQQIKPLNIKGI